MSADLVEITFGYVQTYHGRKVWLDPGRYDPSSLQVDDVATALPHINRYCGHTQVPYSVAQHCVLLAQALMKEGCDREIVAWGLIHDWAETYISDIPRPFKKAMPRIDKLDEWITSVFADRFGLPTEMPAIVRDWDQRMCRNEMDLLSSGKVPPENRWWTQLEPVPHLTPNDVSPRDPSEVRWALRMSARQLGLVDWMGF